MEVNASHRESLWREKLVIAGVVAQYWFISISMVFLNKKILSGIEAPFFVTWFQCFISLLITGGLSIWLHGISLREVFHESDRLSEVDYKRLQLSEEESGSIVRRYLTRWFNIPVIHVRLSTARRIFPLSFVFVSMISLNNLCLKNVGVAFYFVGRSLTTVFNVVLTWLILRKKTSLPAVLCCLGIVFGFSLGVDQENLIGTLSVSGVIYGVLASLFVSLNSIYVADMLPIVENNICLLTFYNNLNAMLLFAPMIIFAGELGPVMEQLSLSIESIMFWLFMLLTGVFGLLISFVTSVQIKYTSPLTHNISGTAKACSQTVLATYLYHESKTFHWWLSNFIVLGASAIYTWVKQREMNKAHQTQLDTKANLSINTTEHKLQSVSVK